MPQRQTVEERRGDGAGSRPFEMTMKAWKPLGNGSGVFLSLAPAVTLGLMSVATSAKPGHTPRSNSRTAQASGNARRNGSGTSKSRDKSAAPSGA